MANEAQQNNPVADTNLPALPPQVIEQLTQNQARELQIRAEELALKQQEDKHAFQHAQEVLKAQAEDRKDDRKYRAKNARTTYIFFFLIVLIILFFIGFLVVNNKDQIAMELIKTVLYIGTGLIGGYFWGRLKQNVPQDSDDTA